MKKMLFALLAMAIVLSAGTVHAFAIYNHVDHRVCVSTGSFTEIFKKCKFRISANGTHNGGHGDGLDHARISWKYGSGRTDVACTNDRIDIPNGGYARIYNHEVKVYSHSGQRTDVVKVIKHDCFVSPL